MKQAKHPEAPYFYDLAERTVKAASGLPLAWQVDECVSDLFVASPEMLECLKWVRNEWIKELRPSGDIARVAALITKAEGRS